ncbi:MAG: serine hydrolase [Pseudomonadota bacterium]
MRYILLATLLALPSPTLAQPASSPSAAALQTALDTRAAELVPLLNGGGDPATMFAPAFLSQISAEQVRAVSTQLTAGIGKAQRVGGIDRKGANAGDVTIVGERGTVVLRLTLSAEAPNLIVGLVVTGGGPTAAAEATLPAVIDALKALPGATGFALADLGTKPVIVAGHAADRPLAIGSAFKLVILAELVRATAAGERKWDDLVTLDGTELPAGGYNLKPKGTQVSLRELATQMISISDNSATDVLLATLGRRKVEAMLKTIGIRDAARNRPFLNTMEAFKLKGVAALRTAWLSADERARRALLTGAVATTPGSAIGDLFADGKPVLIDRIEWFASPADLVRVMDWLRVRTESGPGAEARRILAVNPGIAKADAARFDYVGFKGGSEPGVINLTLLLRDRAGGWHALTGSWNDPTAGVDVGRFVALMTRAAELTATR